MDPSPAKETHLLDLIRATCPLEVPESHDIPAAAASRQKLRRSSADASDAHAAAQAPPSKRGSAALAELEERRRQKLAQLRQQHTQHKAELLRQLQQEVLHTTAAAESAASAAHSSISPVLHAGLQHQAPGQHAAAQLQQPVSLAALQQQQQQRQRIPQPHAAIAVPHTAVAGATPAAAWAASASPARAPAAAAGVGPTTAAGGHWLPRPPTGPQQTPPRRAAASSPSKSTAAAAASPAAGSSKGAAAASGSKPSAKRKAAAVTHVPAPSYAVKKVGEYDRPWRAAMKRPAPAPKGKQAASWAVGQLAAGGGGVGAAAAAAKARTPEQQAELQAFIERRRNQMAAQEEQARTARAAEEKRQQAVRSIAQQQRLAARAAASRRGSTDDAPQGGWQPASPWRGVLSAESSGATDKLLPPGASGAQEPPGGVTQGASLDAEDSWLHQPVQQQHKTQQAHRSPAAVAAAARAGTAAAAAVQAGAGRIKSPGRTVSPTKVPLDPKRDTHPGVAYLADQMHLAARRAYEHLQLLQRQRRRAAAAATAAASSPAATPGFALSAAPWRSPPKPGAHPQNRSPGKVTTTKSPASSPTKRKPKRRQLAVDDGVGVPAVQELPAVEEEEGPWAVLQQQQHLEEQLEEQLQLLQQQQPSTESEAWEVQHALAAERYTAEEAQAPLYSAPVATRQPAAGGGQVRAARRLYAAEPPPEADQFSAAEAVSGPAGWVGAPAGRRAGLPAVQPPAGPLPAAAGSPQIPRPSPAAAAAAAMLPAGPAEAGYSQHHPTGPNGLYAAAQQQQQQQQNSAGGGWGAQQMPAQYPGDWRASPPAAAPVAYVSAEASPVAPAQLTAAPAGRAPGSAGYQAQLVADAAAAAATNYYAAAAVLGGVDEAGSAEPPPDPWVQQQISKLQHQATQLYERILRLYEQPPAPPRAPQPAPAAAATAELASAHHSAEAAASPAALHSSATAAAGPPAYAPPTAAVPVAASVAAAAAGPRPPPSSAPVGGPGLQQQGSAASLQEWAAPPANAALGTVRAGFLAQVDSSSSVDGLGPSPLQQQHHHHHHQQQQTRLQDAAVQAVLEEQQQQGNQLYPPQASRADNSSSTGPPSSLRDEVSAATAAAAGAARGGVGDSAGFGPGPALTSSTDWEVELALLQQRRQRHHPQQEQQPEEEEAQAQRLALLQRERQQQRPQDKQLPEAEEEAERQRLALLQRARQQQQQQRPQHKQQPEAEEEEEEEQRPALLEKQQQQHPGPGASYSKLYRQYLRSSQQRQREVQQHRLGLLQRRALQQLQCSLQQVAEALAAGPARAHQALLRAAGGGQGRPGQLGGFGAAGASTLFTEGSFCSSIAGGASHQQQAGAAGVEEQQAEAGAEEPLSCEQVVVQMQEQRMPAAACDQLRKWLRQQSGWQGRDGEDGSSKKRPLALALRTPPSAVWPQRITGDVHSVVNLLAKRVVQRRQQQQQQSHALPWSRSSPPAAPLWQDARQAPDQEPQQPPQALHQQQQQQQLLLRAPSPAAATRAGQEADAAEHSSPYRQTIQAELQLLRARVAAGVSANSSINVDALAAAQPAISPLTRSMEAAAAAPGGTAASSQELVLSSSERSLSSAVRDQAELLGRQRAVLAEHLQELRRSREQLSPRSLQRAYDQGMERLQQLHQSELQLGALESAAELAALQQQAALIAQELDQQHLVAALAERHHMMEQEQAEQSAALAHRLARDILSEGFAQLQQVAAQLQQQQQQQQEVRLAAVTPPPDVCSTGVQAEFSWPALPQPAADAPDAPPAEGAWQLPSRHQLLEQRSSSRQQLSGFPQVSAAEPGAESARSPSESAYSDTFELAEPSGLGAGSYQAKPTSTSSVQEEVEAAGAATSLLPSRTSSLAQQLPSGQPSSSSGMWRGLQQPSAVASAVSVASSTDVAAAAKATPAAGSSLASSISSLAGSSLPSQPATRHTQQQQQQQRQAAQQQLASAADKAAAGGGGMDGLPLLQQLVEAEEQQLDVAGLGPVSVLQQERAACRAQLSAAQADASRALLALATRLTLTKDAEQQAVLRRQALATKLQGEFVKCQLQRRLVDLEAQLTLARMLAAGAPTGQLLQQWAVSGATSLPPAAAGHGAATAAAVSAVASEEQLRLSGGAAMQLSTRSSRLQSPAESVAELLPSGSAATPAHLTPRSSIIAEQSGLADQVVSERGGSITPSAVGTSMDQSYTDDFEPALTDSPSLGAVSGQQRRAAGRAAAMALPPQPQTRPAAAAAHKPGRADSLEEQQLRVAQLQQLLAERQRAAEKAALSQQEQLLMQQLAALGVQVPGAAPAAQALRETWEREQLQLRAALAAAAAANAAKGPGGKGAAAAVGASSAPSVQSTAYSADWETPTAASVVASVVASVAASVAASEIPEDQPHLELVGAAMEVADSSTASRSGTPPSDVSGSQGEGAVRRSVAASVTSEGEGPAQQPSSSSWQPAMPGVFLAPSASSWSMGSSRQAPQTQQQQQPSRSQPAGEEGKGGQAEGASSAAESVGYAESVDYDEMDIMYSSGDEQEAPAAARAAVAALPLSRPLGEPAPGVPRLARAPGPAQQQESDAEDGLGDYSVEFDELSGQLGEQAAAGSEEQLVVQQLPRGDARDADGSSDGGDLELTAGQTIAEPTAQTGLERGDRQTHPLQQVVAPPATAAVSQEASSEEEVVGEDVVEEQEEPSSSRRSSFGLAGEAPRGDSGPAWWEGLAADASAASAASSGHSAAAAAGGYPLVAEQDIEMLQEGSLLGQRSQQQLPGSRSQQQLSGSKSQQQLPGSRSHQYEDVRPAAEEEWQEEIGASLPGHLEDEEDGTSAASSSPMALLRDKVQRLVMQQQRVVSSSSSSSSGDSEAGDHSVEAEAMLPGEVEHLDLQQLLEDAEQVQQEWQQLQQQHSRELGTPLGATAQQLQGPPQATAAESRALADYAAELEQLDQQVSELAAQLSDPEQQEQDAVQVAAAGSSASLAAAPTPDATIAAAVTAEAAVEDLWQQLLQDTLQRAANLCQQLGGSSSGASPANSAAQLQLLPSTAAGVPTSWQPAAGAPAAAVSAADGSTVYGVDKERSSLEMGSPHLSLDGSQVSELLRDVEVGSGSSSTPTSGGGAVDAVAEVGARTGGPPPLLAEDTRAPWAVDAAEDEVESTRAGQDTTAAAAGAQEAAAAAAAELDGDGWMYRTRGRQAYGGGSWYSDSGEDPAGLDAAAVDYLEGPGEAEEEVAVGGEQQEEEGGEDLMSCQRLGRRGGQQQEQEQQEEDSSAAAADVDDEFDWEVPEPATAAAAGDAAAPQSPGAASEASSSASRGYPTGRRTPDPPVPMVDATTPHIRGYLGQVMEMWVSSCSPSTPQEGAGAGADSAAAAAGGGSPLRLPRVVAPGETLLRLEQYLQLERAGPSAADAQHIHHKALYDAANEALLAAYARRGRLLPPDGAGLPGAAGLGSPRPLPPPQQLVGEVVNTVLGWAGAQVRGEAGLEALLAAQAAEAERDWRDLSQETKVVTEQLSNGLWEELLEDTAASVKALT